MSVGVQRAARRTPGGGPLARRPGRATVPALLVTSLVLAGCGAPAAPPAILLVTLDTVRADRLSAYGHPAPTSPNLAWLARRGVRFDLALAPSPSTAPSHVSIFTGRYPSFHAVGAYNSQFALGEAATTLAEQLREEGWATAAVVSNPILRRKLGLDQGFDHYDDETRGEGPLESKGRRADRAVDAALAWLDGRPPGPFLLWLHLQDPHGPYAPPAGWVCPVASPRLARADDRVLPPGRDHSGHGAIPLYQTRPAERALSQYLHRYDCELAYHDAQLGRLLARFAAEPALADALQVVTADHGEAFGEDGFFFQHGHGVGLDQVRVPLIVVGPGVIGGAIVEGAVSLASLYPTLLAYAGLEAPDADPAGSEGPGSLWRALESGAAPDESVFVESLNQVGVARGRQFVRRDLHPASDHGFWRGGNPNSGGGYWKPLGRESRLLSTRAAAPSDPGDDPVGDPDGEPGADLRADLDAELDAYAERALEARNRRRASQQTLELSPGQRKALIELGYLEP